METNSLNPYVCTGTAIITGDPLNFGKSAKGDEEKDLQKEFSCHPANDTKIKDIPNREKLLELSETERDSFKREYIDYVSKRVDEVLELRKYIPSIAASTVEMSNQTITCSSCQTTLKLSSTQCGICQKNLTMRDFEAPATCGVVYTFTEKKGRSQLIAALFFLQKRETL